MTVAFRQEKSEQPSFVFRAGLFEYLLVCIPPILLFANLLVHPDPVGLLLVFVIVSLLCYWRYTYLFKVTPLVVYKRANFREQAIPFSALAQVVIVTGGKPPIAMIFIPKADSKLESITINIKPLRRNDLQRLAVFLPKAAPEVEYDPRFLLMAEGKMPSLFFSYHQTKKFR